MSQWVGQILPSPAQPRVQNASFPDQIADLLYSLRKVYRRQNSYHNFEHAVDVLQATHTFLCAAGRVPPVSILQDNGARTWRPNRKCMTESLTSCLTNEDLFCLYVASIGHDTGHPGFTNVFMVITIPIAARVPFCTESSFPLFSRKTQKLPYHHCTTIPRWNRCTVPCCCTSCGDRDWAFS